MLAPSEKKQTILFIIAMEQEATHLRSYLKLEKDLSMEANPICDSWIGPYEGMQIIMMLAKEDRKYKCDSIGPETACVLTYIGVETYKPDLIVSAGTAGAFEIELGKKNCYEVGDMCYAKEGVPFIDRDFVYDNFMEYMEGRYDVVVFEQIFEKLGFKESVIGTTTSFYDYCKDYSISKKVDVQEMEAAGVGKIAYLMQIPFMAIKIISNIEYGEKVPDQCGEQFWPMLDTVSEHLGKKIVAFLQEISKIDIRKTNGNVKKV